MVAGAVASSGCSKRDEFHSEAVSKELSRLSASLGAVEKKPAAAGLATLVKQHRDALAKANAASSPALRLYRLREPFIGTETLAYLTSHSEAAKELRAFEKLWKEERSVIERDSSVSGNRVQRALHEAALNRSRVLFHASLPYGRASSPGDGLYYLSEAVANRRFADFLRSLGGDSKESSPSSEAVASALEGLEGDTLAAFAKEPSGKTTIPVSALLKESRELLRRGSIDGATLLLLEARLALSKRAGDLSQVPDSARKVRPGNDSFAALIEALAAESEPEVRKIVLTQVAPMYASLFELTAVRSSAAPPVTITLVRWPYT